MGISSAFPLPLGSLSLNALSIASNSAVVVGSLSPSFFSHGLYTYIFQSIEQW